MRQRKMVMVAVVAMEIRGRQPSTTQSGLIEYSDDLPYSSTAIRAGQDHEQMTKSGETMKPERR